jgi:hypothetical protein
MVLDLCEWSRDYIAQTDADAAVALVPKRVTQWRTSLYGLRLGGVR